MGLLDWLMRKERRRRETALRLLAERGVLYGLELVEGSAGALRRGTVYVTLQRLEEDGLVASMKEADPLRRGRLPRRIYWITAKGRAALARPGEPR